jgi:hypothetical protein
MGLSTRRRALLVKLETTYGTDPTPSAATDGVLMADVSLEPLNTETAEREVVRPFFGANQSLVTTKFAKLNVKLEAAGFGVAGPVAATPGYDALLQACGMLGILDPDVQWDYSPVSSGLKSVTAYLYMDGRLHKLTGCRGNFRLMFKANEIPYFDFELWGLYNAPTDAAIVTPTLTAYQTPQAAGKEFDTLTSLFGAVSGLCVESLEINLGNQVIPPQGRINCTNEVMITDRKISGSLTVESTLVAAKDWWTSIANSSLGALDYTHGTASGNQVQLASARMELSNPRFGEEDDVEMLTLDTRFVPLAAGDELTLTIK